MSGNNQNLNNSNNQKKKKGNGLKILLVIIILIMAAIIGLLSWLLASGKDFSTIFNEIEQSISNKNSNKVDSKEDENKDNNNNNKGNNSKGDISGNGENIDKKSNNTNLKDSFKVSYETRGVRNITIEGASFVCNEDVPHISGIGSDAASKIEKRLNSWYSDVWKDINEQTKDEEIKEILTQMNENSKKYGSSLEDIGFHQSYKVIYLTNKVVTFQHILEGGLGGVGWGNTSGISFDLETGNVIEVKDLVTSKDKYIEACKNYVYAELKKDSRYDEVVEMHGDNYQDIVNSAIEKIGGYFVEDGIVCVEIPKYSIASGASGEFRYTIPYSLIKDYMNNKYFENSSNTTNAKASYTTAELEKMALDYYEKNNSYRPSLVASQVNEDGTVSIQLYDDMGDHNSTSQWYTVDPKTAVGTDILGDKVDLKK